MTTRTATHQLDTTAISLTRLLSRLEHTLLSPEADPNLRKSSYERTKVGANLEYARSLLLRLEYDSASIKVQSRKQTVQADLQSKRNLIKQLNQRLYELNQLDDESDDGSVSEDENEDLFPSYAPAVRNTSDTINQVNTGGDQALQEAAASPTSTLRSRRSQPATAPVDTSTTTSASLFPANTQFGDPNLAQTESLLSHNRTEQEALTNSLLSMAQALKLQSIHFGSTLESEKTILNRAVEGLDKNTTGMAAAGQRIGTLKRMTEGKGWWNRIKLYALIAALWFLAFSIVFILPKFRF
ncbi:uncharacterized protein K441DRAFT_600179 [Cenococcum geophilum 1.58]|uniref:uncharacterized protein n=1 Tax=Cenococcum geophilum 1.58 TaxID=794803 RepID=UPI00358FAFCF|nr:hypothetical protein K441DRAFT_600179 [Cenococcum geophilum 1.58]